MNFGAKRCACFSYINWTAGKPIWRGRRKFAENLIYDRWWSQYPQMINFRIYIIYDSLYLDNNPSRRRLCWIQTSPPCLDINSRFSNLQKKPTWERGEANKSLLQYKWQYWRIQLLDHFAKDYPHSLLPFLQDWGTISISLFRSISIYKPHCVAVYGCWLLLFFKAYCSTFFTSHN